MLQLAPPSLTAQVDYLRELVVVDVEPVDEVEFDPIALNVPTPPPPLDVAPSTKRR